MRSIPGADRSEECLLTGYVARLHVVRHAGIVLAGTCDNDAVESVAVAIGELQGSLLTAEIEKTLLQNYCRVRLGFFAFIAIAFIGCFGSLGLLGLVILLLFEDLCPTSLKRIVIDRIEDARTLFTYQRHFRHERRMYVGRIFQYDIVHTVRQCLDVFAPLAGSRRRIVDGYENNLVVASLVIAQRLHVLRIEFGILLLQRWTVNIKALGLSPFVARHECKKHYDRKEKFDDIRFHDALRFTVIGLTGCSPTTTGLPYCLCRRAAS